MDTLTVEHEKLAKKQKTTSKDINANLDSMIAQIERIKSTQSTASAAADKSTSTLSAMVSSVKDFSAKIQESHRDLQTSLHKYSKALEKKFKVDLEGVTQIVHPEAFDGKEDIVAKSLVFHAIREGRFEVADMLIQETNLDYPEASSLKHGFQDLYQTLESIRQRILGPAITWAKEHAEHLRKKGSPLAFELHKLQFLQNLLSVTPATTAALLPALEYAKTYFHEFSASNFQDIKMLMCSVLYVKKLERSPYSKIYQVDAWNTIQHLFTKEYCQFLGLPSESPLYVAVTVGTNALPTLIKMSTVMRQAGTEWSQSDELPVEIPLQDSHHFHSVFVCPVSKDLCTSEDNPPMMMQCGHVISKESLMRIAKGNLSSRFKCPYCPMETTASQALRVFF